MCKDERKQDPYTLCSNPEYSVRPSRAIRSFTGKALRKVSPAHFNRLDKTIGNAAISHVCNQRIDGRLPLRSRYSGSRS
jgi:hypothetical protein